jgi:4-amino-4-deoxy-L-arabinose transferase-like glycosyltransferase
MWTFFGLALLVYVPAIWWGMPEGVSADRSRPWGTDELAPVGAVNEVYGVFAANNPGFNPQYPLFHYLVQLVLVGPYYAFLWLTGHVSPAPFFPFGLDHPASEIGVLTLLARAVSLLMAAGVVVVAFRTGEVLRGRSVGILTALLVLLQYPMFYYSRTSNVDMGALFWTALGLLFFARFLTSGATPRLALGLGVAAALAVASKDASYGAFLPVGIAFVVLHLRAMRREGARWMEALRLPVYAFLASVAVYAVSSGLVFHPGRYVRHIQFITTHDGDVGAFYFRYAPTLTGYLSVGRELLQNLTDAVGLPMLLCALGGVVYWTARDRRLLLWIIPALGIVACVIAPVRFVQLRFVLVIAYVLALPAADLLARGLARPALLRRLSMAALVSVVAWSGLRGADLTYQMLRDARHSAAGWLGAAARSGDRVGHFVPARNLPNLPQGVRTVALDPAKFVSLPADARPEFIISIPLRDIEPVHERLLPEETFQQLIDGSLGYRQAVLVEGPTLFSRRPATYVNPPVRIFIRDDLRGSRIEKR